MRGVWIQFELSTIAALGCPLSRGGLSLEACTALEDALLTFPAFYIQLCWPESDQRRAGRPAFLSSTIASAFPRLNERGLLTLPHSTSKPDLPDHKELILSVPKRILQIRSATKVL